MTSRNFEEYCTLLFIYFVVSRVLTESLSYHRCQMNFTSSVVKVGVISEICISVCCCRVSVVRVSTCTTCCCRSFATAPTCNSQHMSICVRMLLTCGLPLCSARPASLHVCLISMQTCRLCSVSRLCFCWQSLLNELFSINNLWLVFHVMHHSVVNVLVALPSKSFTFLLLVNERLSDIICHKLGNWVIAITFILNWLTQFGHLFPIFSRYFNHFSLKVIILHLTLRYGESVDNTAEENSSIFSLIWMCWLPSAKACGQ